MDYSKHGKIPPVDFYPPRDPSIPYFVNTFSFRQYPRPSVDGFTPQNCRAWRIEPGYHEVEMYEAMIRAKLGYSKKLQVWISQAGLQLHLPSASRPCFGGQGVDPRRDHSDFEDRDVCFVLLPWDEHQAVWNWITAHGYASCPIVTIITPIIGVYNITLSRDKEIPKEVVQKYREELGLEGQEQTRTVFSRYHCPFQNDIRRPLKLPSSGPLPDVQTRAAADPEGLKRIYWNWTSPEKHLAGTVDSAGGGGC